MHDDDCDGSAHNESTEYIEDNHFVLMTLPRSVCTGEKRVVQLCAVCDFLGALA